MNTLAQELQRSFHESEVHELQAKQMRKPSQDAQGGWRSLVWLVLDELYRHGHSKCCLSKTEFPFRHHCEAMSYFVTEVDSGYGEDGFAINGKGWTACSRITISIQRTHASQWEITFSLVHLVTRWWSTFGYKQWEKPLLSFHHSSVHTLGREKAVFEYDVVMYGCCFVRRGFF